MNIATHKLQCYLEGIRVPINSIAINYERNQINNARIQIPIGGQIIPHLWANAFIQISQLQNLKEKLFFQGLVSEIEVIDDDGFINVDAQSIWDSLNLNSTLDYTAPKKYGIQNVEDEITIYLGNEDTIVSDNLSADNYQLSRRYFFLSSDNQDNKQSIDLNSSEAFKLQFIADRNPFALLFAFSIFEQIAYENFILSQAYISRFNLLKKVKVDSIRELEFLQQRIESQETSAAMLELDSSRSGLQYKITKQNKKVVEDILESQSATQDGTVVGGTIKCLTFPTKISEDLIKTKLTEFYKTNVVHPGFNINLIFDPCKRLNVNPFLIVAIATHESANGTAGKGKSTKNPGNVGNTNDGGTIGNDTWVNGWFLLVNQVARRLGGKRGPPSQSIENLGGMNNGKLDSNYPVWAWPDLRSWINRVSDIFQSLKGCEGV